MSKTRILAIEDEKDILKILRYNLEKEGYEAATATDGETGLKLVRQLKPNLVILDIMLPKMDGLQVCRALRQENNPVPILILSVKKSEVDRVVGLEIGADDYLTKPFSVRELLARVKALLRRREPAAGERGLARHGELEIDVERYTASLRGKPVPLSSKEFELLKTLLAADGKPLTREQLLENVWASDVAAELDTRTVDQHIARLRGKLGSEAKRVVTVKNVGYRFQKE